MSNLILMVEIQSIQVGNNRQPDKKIVVCLKLQIKKQILHTKTKTKTTTITTIITTTKTQKSQGDIKQSK